MKKIVLLFIVFINVSVYAQKRDNIWEVGYHGKIFGGAGINFINGIPDTFSVGYRPMTFWFTNSGICDSNGNLLFYTNGQWIANRKNDSLQNCKNFNPGIENAEYANQGQPYVESFVILPVPSDDNRYYLIGTNGEEVYSRGFYQDKPLDIRYSIVDMTKDSGYGAIDSNYKAIIILKDSIARGFITACKHGNGRDWWIVFHQWYYNRFYKLLLTPAGISKIDSQNIGSIIPNDIIGQACFSPDGSHYALMRNSGDLDIFNFDRCSGLFSDSINIKVPIITPYDFFYGPFGCAFSSSGRYLYVDDESHLYQYDLQSSNVDGSRILIAKYLDDTSIDPNGFDVFSELQLGPDKKIYMPSWGGSEYVHIINLPDNEGMNCNFKQYQLVLSDFNVSVPAFPNYRLGLESGSACDTLTSIKEIKIKNGELKIIPNPTSGLGNVYVENENYQSALLEIDNALGERVFSQNIDHWIGAQSFNITWLPEGIYFIKVEIGGKEFIGKVVKE